LKNKCGQKKDFCSFININVKKFIRISNILKILKILNFEKMYLKLYTKLYKYKKNWGSHGPLSPYKGSPLFFLCSSQ